MLHEDLIDVMPAVEEANSISEELDKRVKFEIILIAPNMLGKLKHKHEGFEDRDKTSSQPEVGCTIMQLKFCDILLSCKKYEYLLTCFFY